MANQQSIKTLIQEQTTTLIPYLQEKISQLQCLNRLWQKYIDITLAKYTRVANWRDNRLIIEVDNASCATHIRYSLPELLIKLKTEKELKELKYIEWYIQPAAGDATSTKKTTVQPISTENKGFILEVAEYTKHEKLKRALLALVQ